MECFHWMYTKKKRVKRKKMNKIVEYTRGAADDCGTVGGGETTSWTDGRADWNNSSSSSI